MSTIPNIYSIKAWGFSVKAIDKAVHFRSVFQKAFPNRTWVIMPCMNMMKLAIVSKESIDEGDNGVAAMILDHLPKSK